MTAVAHANAISPHPLQQQFIEAALSGDYLYLGFGGAIRGGKTYAVLVLVLLLCKLFPRSRWAVVRETLEILKKNTLPSWSKVRSAGFCGPVHQTDWTVTCANGSQIIFWQEGYEDDKDYDRWKGLEVNGFVLEQAEELQRTSFTMAVQRAGSWIIPPTATDPTPRQPNPLILLTFNPHPGWVKDTFYDPWVGNVLEAPYFYLPALPEDNPYLPTLYLEGLKNLPEHDYRRYVKGMWDQLTGKALPMLNDRVHIVPSFRLPAHWRRFAALDWGFRHNTAFVHAAANEDGSVFVVDTAWGQWLLPGELVERFRATGADLAQLDYCDAGHDLWNEDRAKGSVGETLYKQFYDLGLTCRKANIARIQGLNALRYALTWKLANGERIDPPLRFMDTLGNRRLVKQLHGMMLDDKATGAKAEDVRKVDTDPQGQGGDDGYDATRYLAAGRWSRAADQEPMRTLVDPVQWAIAHEKERRVNRVAPERKKKRGGIDDPELAGYA